MPLLRLLTLLVAVAVATALVVAWLSGTAAGEDEGGGGAPPQNVGALRLVTLPELHPASMTPTVVSDAVSPGFLFVTPGSSMYGETGPMIVDDTGQPIWVGTVPDGENATTFSVQRYGGQPVLTWWEGRIDKELGMGVGVGVIMDTSYRRIATVRAGNAFTTDLHDFVITPRDTALLIIYAHREADLSDYGGSAEGQVLDNLVQEVDIESGRVLFEWSALDNVPPDESYKEAPDGGGPWDPYHLNSVAMDEEGDLLVSARHTWAVYKIDGERGAVVWRLGGKRSDFTLGEGAQFAWQHDARWRPDGTLSLYDNEAAADDLREAPASRGIVLRLDEEARTAELVREFVHPAGLLAQSQGNLQNLPSGNVLVGWGSKPHLSEYDSAGRLVFDLRFHATNQSYRAFRSTWTGTPEEPPTVVARREGDRTRLYVSWNGATEVASWRVLAAASEGAEPAELTTAPRDGFETSIPVAGDGPWFVVEGLDAAGRVIGTSARVTATTSGSPTPSPSPSVTPVSSPSPAAYR